MSFRTNISPHQYLIFVLKEKGSRFCDFPFYFIVKLNYPFAVNEKLFFASVKTDTNNFQVFCTNHKVNVNDACVQADFVCLLFVHIVATFNGSGVGCAKCQVATCVFIKQRLVVEQATFCNGGFFANESNFAYASASFVRCQNAFEGSISFFC